MAAAWEQIVWRRRTQLQIELPSCGPSIATLIKLIAKSQVFILNRVEEDVQTVAFSAKDFYDRPRPYQRFQMEHVCGAEKAPAPEVPLKDGSSYPSGHTSFGWAAVLVLAEVEPEHAQGLLARGQEYGESRIVCAVHYPSDVVGGQLVATAAVARLHTDVEFEEDLQCAKDEHAASKGGKAVSPSCQLREAQWSKGRRRDYVNF